MQKKMFLLITIAMLFFLTELFKAQAIMRMEIKDGWKFKQEDDTEWMNASVPGTVHTDLMNNNKIPDPYFGMNEQNLQWIGEKNWYYQTSFDIGDDMLNKKNIKVVFKGLDTYAVVYLNNLHVLKAENMFREWSVNCKNLLKSKNNIIRIEFRNVFSENMPKYNSAPYRLMAFDNNDQAEIKINMYSRKAGFHFGWDWGPRLITYGIWRPVFIEAWDNFKINDVFVVQKNVSRQNAEINSAIEVLSDSDQPATLNIFVNGQPKKEIKINLTKGLNKIDADFDIENPDLWWTNGLGKQNLYKLNFKISTGVDFSDEKELKIGIRSLEVVREKDSIGTSFYFKLNGVPVFAKGANYIPQDNFQNRVSHERYRFIVKSAADANMNILRIWGGGIYEEDIFYELCDEYGILVWQDFMFACAMYPADENYLENVRCEITDNVRRIRNHPSLALYCGNNENEIAWFQWGWKQLYSEEQQKIIESDYKKLFYETIPNTLQEVDPTRYYHPSSPGASYGNFSYENGDAHYWSVWHGKEPFETYGNNIARFMSEYGFQSYPEMKTIEKFTNPEDRHLHSDVMLSHQRCMSDARRDKEYGNRLIQWYMERMFKQPKDFESYVYVAQVLQAEGVKIAIEAHRRNMPKNMGTMFWQIDDCWPVASWSSIDYYGNWKALHYYTKKAYYKFMISSVKNGDSIDVFVVSDDLRIIPALLEIKLLDFKGNEIFNKTLNAEIPANSSKKYFSINKKDLIGEANENNIFMLTQLKSGGNLLTENVFYFKEPKELFLEEPNIQVSYTKKQNSYELILKSDKLVKNAYLSFDGEGFFNDNYFDILPNRETKIFFTIKSDSVDIKNKIKIISLIDSY